MILCLIFSITGVSASDVNTTDNQVLSATPDIDTLSVSVNMEQKNNTLSVSENDLLSAGNDDSGSNELLGAGEETGSFADLDKLIKLSQGELILTQNYKYNPDTDSAFAGGISISKTININGNNYIINGSDVASVFVVDANNVIIKNLNIINAPLSISWNGHDGKLINTTFNNITQTSSSTGSCVNWVGTSGEILNSTFNNINDDSIGAVYIAGGANVINSTFSNITKLANLGYWGLAISIPSVASMNNKIIGCSFINCTGRGATINKGGGLIYAQRNIITVIDCSFINNSLHSTLDSSYGVFGEPIELHVTDCLFAGNDIDRLSGSKYVEILGSTFINEKYYYDCLGSPAMNYVNIIDCIFKNINNTQIINFKNPGFLNVNNASFININGANAIITQNSADYASISSCNFINSSVTGSAPIIVNTNKNIIEDCLFDNTTGTDAYAIDIKESALLNLENYKVINTPNILPNITGNLTSFIYYPVLYLKDSNNVYSDSEMTNRVGDSLEWALKNINYLGTIYLYNYVFDLNSTQYPIISNIIGDNKVIINNGSFSYNVPNIKIENITFNDTKSYFHLMRSQLINCTFDNISQSNDYFISCTYGSVGELYNLTFINLNSNNHTIIKMEEHNVVDGLDFQGIINAKYIIFANSYANDITIRHVNVTNSVFNQFFHKSDTQKNHALFEYINITGNTFKVFHNSVGSNYRFNNITIAYNRGFTDNYFFYVRTGYEFNNITVINNINSPTQSIFKLWENLVLHDSYFEGISTSNFIQGNYNCYLDNITLKTVNFNTLHNDDKLALINHITVSDANFSSGTIFTLGNDMVLADSNFTDFTGHVVVAGKNIVIRDTNFTRGNNSDLNGGAVYVESGDFLTIENCRFISNNASYGGAVYSNANPTAIMNSVFEDNRALANNGTTSCGGAIYIGDVYNSIDDFTKSYLLDELNYNDLRLVNPDNTLFTVIYVVPYWQEYKNNESLSGDGSGKDINNPTNISDARIKVGPYCEIYFINNPDWSSNYYNMTNATINPDNVGEFVVRYSGMVFYGNNSVIDSLYFTVDGANATFKDLTFTNNTGHSALVINQEDSVVDNCTFLNNGGEAVSAGAAIQVLANNTSILNSTFTSNLAGNISGANGGAVFINASFISIGDCHFSDNQAYTTGSHLFVVDDNELRDISLIDCNFTGGSVSGSGLGSGVYLSGDNLVVYNSNFTDNIGRQGAGLTVTGSTINLNITGNNFTDNRAIPQTIGDSGNFVGGAVFFDSSRGPVSIVDNIFTGNNASIDGGALYINNMPGSGNILAGNVFSDNHALGGNGGAVYVNKVDYPLTVSGGEFTDNNATGNGGALYVNAPVNVDGVDFINNEAISGDGGAVFNNGTLSVSNSNFEENVAKVDGGAIFNNGNLSLDNDVFTDNGAVDGGAVFNDGVLVDKGSRYIGNVATRDGGAIYSKSDLDYSTTRSIASFSGNRAVNGGAVYVNGTNNNIRGALFTDNSADFGSCIYAENGSDLNVYDVEITGNHVTNGPQASGGHGDIYLGEIVNFAIPTDSLKLDLARPDGSSDYTQYIYNNTMVRSDVLYVSESGTGLGLMSNDPTTLEKAFVAINDNGRIVFVESYMLNTTTINRNVTLAGYNSTISMKRNNSTAGENKYLFKYLIKYFINYLNSLCSVSAKIASLTLIIIQ